MKKIFLLLVLISSFGFVNHSFASLSISPLKFEFDISELSSKKEKIKVTNNYDYPITLYSSSEDFIAGDDTGTPKFIKPGDQINPEYSLSNWIDVEDQNVTLAPKESREIYFDVNVPKNAEPGGHYAAIFFSPGVPSGAQVAVVQRLGVLVLVNVPGEVHIEGELKSFKIGETIEKTFEEKNDFKDFPIVFQTVFENMGNIHLKPTGKITLTDEDGETLKNIGKETLSTPAGAYIGEKMVDYIPINDTSGNVLPKSERRFEIPWMGFGYNVLNEDGTKSVLFKNLEEYYADKTAEKAQYLMFWQKVNSRTVKKKITANFELSYEGKDKQLKEFHDKKEFYVTYSEKYIGINYILVGVLGIIIILIGVYFFIVVPKARLKREEELKKKIMEEMRKQ